MVLRVLLALTALAFFRAALAFQNEPDGFRGIKWGSDFKKYASEMTLISDNEMRKESRCLRKGDKLARH